MQYAGHEIGDLKPFDLRQSTRTFSTHKEEYVHCIEPTVLGKGKDRIAGYVVSAMLAEHALTIKENLDWFLRVSIDGGYVLFYGTATGDYSSTELLKAVAGRLSNQKNAGSREKASGDDLDRIIREEAAKMEEQIRTQKTKMPPQPNPANVSAATNP